MSKSSPFPGEKIEGQTDIIAISGFAGSGKNTVGAQVAIRMGWRIVEPTFKTLAEREGVSLMQFQQKARADPDIDRKFDEALQEECVGGKCVVATWLGPWMAPGKPFRVWLEVSTEVRTKRLAGREEMSLDNAMAHLRMRDLDNQARYKKVYGIDINDHAGFDLVLDASVKKPAQLADEIIAAYKKRSREKNEKLN